MTRLLRLSEQVAEACRRGAGGDPAQVLRMVEEGEAQLIALGDASASWRVIGPRAVEVLHLYGSMRQAERLHWMAVQSGVLRYEWEGRASWARALQRMDRRRMEV